MHRNINIIKRRCPGAFSLLIVPSNFFPSTSSSLLSYSDKQAERPPCLNACLKQCFNSVKALVGASRKKKGKEAPYLIIVKISAKYLWHLYKTYPRARHWGAKYAVVSHICTYWHWDPCLDCGSVRTEWSIQCRHHRFIKSPTVRRK